VSLGINVKLITKAVSMNKLVTGKQWIDTTARVGSIPIYNQKHATCTRIKCRATCTRIKCRANDIPYVRVSTYRDTLLSPHF
jgi:hypothetical protein